MTALSSLTDRTIGDYLVALGSSAPAPGGGSVGGLIGALAAALGQMVANVSAKGSDSPAFAAQVTTLQSRLDAFVAGAEADESAYGGYVAATSMPKTTPEEKTIRRQVLQEALHASARAPVGVVATATLLLEDLIPVIESGAMNILSDAEIAIALAEAAVVAGLVNVRINLPMIKNAGLAESLSEQVTDLEARSKRNAQACRDALATRRKR
ncbi:MAG: cyclodeaminase/cyclohydrolase family protein [Thermomicrobiales bacterium]